MLGLKSFLMAAASALGLRTSLDKEDFAERVIVPQTEIAIDNDLADAGLFRPLRNWAGRMYRKVIPARSPAGYHRLGDAKRAVARLYRYQRSLSRQGISPPWGNVYPRHIVSNYRLGQKQIDAFNASRA